MGFSSGNQHDSYHGRSRRPKYFIISNKNHIDTPIKLNRTIALSETRNQVIVYRKCDNDIEYSLMSLFDSIFVCLLIGNEDNPCDNTPSRETGYYKVSVTAILPSAD